MIGFRILAATFFLTVFNSGNLLAQNFIPATSSPKPIKCIIEKSQIKISHLNLKYRPYDKNISLTKITDCSLIKIDKNSFVNILFSAEIKEAFSINKVLILEVARLDEKKKTLSTLRSEIIDQIPEEGDPANTDFESGAETQWGHDKSKSIIMLKIQPIIKKEKISPFFLKLNKKQNWLENDFSELKK